MGWQSLENTWIGNRAQCNSKQVELIEGFEVSLASGRQTPVIYPLVQDKIISQGHQGCGRKG